MRRPTAARLGALLALPLGLALAPLAPASAGEAPRRPLLSTFEPADFEAPIEETGKRWRLGTPGLEPPLGEGPAPGATIAELGVGAVPLEIGARTDGVAALLSEPVTVSGTLGRLIGEGTAGSLDQLLSDASEDLLEDGLVDSGELPELGELPDLPVLPGL